MLTRPQKASQQASATRLLPLRGQAYCVEQTNGERVLLEDCASGELLDISAGDLDRLTPTRPGRHVAVEQ